MNQKVIEALVAGAEITYSPSSGGLILLTGSERGPSDVNKEIQPTMEEFLELCQSGLITETDSMSQGHHIFHGRVVFYKIAQNLKEKDFEADTMT